MIFCYCILYLSNYSHAVAFTFHLSLFCTSILRQKLPPVHNKEINQSVRAWHQNWRGKKASVRTVEIGGPVISWLGEHCSSHRCCRLPHFPSLRRLLLLSRYGKALRLQSLWASGQVAATAPIQNRRIEGSPKLKALLSLRLVATERRSDRLISLWCLGWPWV